MVNILAIDQSTSATKALLFDAIGVLIDKVSLDHRQIYPQPGWVEHDAEEIWRNTLAALKTLVERNRDAIQHVSHLSLANQRETIVVFERGTGHPVHNAIVWQCRRGDPVCAELADQNDLVAGKTGLKIDTYFPASKLTWLMRHRPEIARRLRDGDALAGTIDAYLVHRFTGGRVFATDHTNASRTLLFDIRDLVWDEGLCSLFEVPCRALPEVRDTTAHFGETDACGLLPHRVPICGVMGDSQASLFAHRCFRPGAAKVTVGTGSSVLLNIGPSLRSPGEGAVATIGWTHGKEPTYALEGIISYSGGTIEWLKNQVGLIRSADETEAAGGSVGDNGGVYLVPAFAGLSAPYWCPEARGAIVGMSAHSGRAHIIRAALESIGYQVRDVVDMMRDRAGIDVRLLHADGGATRNALLMQFIADLTGLELCAARIAECSPLGAALAGALGMGVHGSLEAIGSLPRGPGDVAVYRPKMAPAEVERLYAGWRSAVKQVLAGATPRSDTAGTTAGDSVHAPQAPIGR
ncbi:MAG TPA: glycerol kinase GlpK [Tepidisphaeraceae bacterium]|nr:glycerol kinase GlpK [Tepidisphaeraceae bacterium]